MTCVDARVCLLQRKRHPTACARRSFFQCSLHLWSWMVQTVSRHVTVTLPSSRDGLPCILSAVCGCCQLRCLAVISPPANYVSDAGSYQCLSSVHTLNISCTLIYNPPCASDTQSGPGGDDLQRANVSQHAQAGPLCHGLWSAGTRRPADQDWRPHAHQQKRCGLVR